MYFLAVCRLQSGQAAQVREAELGFTACLARWETLPALSLQFLFNNRGSAYLALGDAAAAEADFRRAVQLDADDPRPFHNLGISMVARGDWASAIEQFTKALTTQPEFAPSLLERARSYRMLAQLPLASADLDRLLALGPANATALAERSLVGLAAGRADAARQDAAKALALDSQLSAPHFVQGCLAAADRRWSDALAAYDRALSIDPKDPQLRNNRVAAYLNLARFQEAMGELDPLLSRHPDYAAARLNRAIASIGLRRLDGVLDDLAKVGSPRTETEAVSFVESFATIALRAGEAFADESSRPVIALCFDRIADVLAQRERKFRETVERLPAMQILLRNPEAEKRLRPAFGP
jgi:tetratricopeptide (TPR) repeat protein